MKIIFRKHEPGVYPGFIRWWTKSIYSHCELLFDDNMKFSAVPSEHGTRYEQARILSPNEWDILFIGIDAPAEGCIRHFCDAEMGCEYDWMGIILSQFARMRREDPRKWFCSEVCAAALQQGGCIPTATPCTLSPGQLFKRLRESGAPQCAQ